VLCGEISYYAGSFLFCSTTAIFTQRRKAPPDLYLRKDPQSLCTLCNNCTLRKREHPWLFHAKNVLVLHYAKRRKAYIRDVFIAHRVKENVLVLLHAKRRKADVPCVIIAHRVKENIHGYFTQRHKDRTSSKLRKDPQRTFSIFNMQRSAKTHQT
jgi:hypothetical protein